MEQGITPPQRVDDGGNTRLIHQPFFADQNQNFVQQNTVNIMEQKVASDMDNLRFFGSEKRLRLVSENEILRELEEIGYEDIRFCAKGGMAILYTAKDPNLNFKNVCIKIAYSETNPIQICVDKLKKEYRILRDLGGVPEVPECFYKIEKDSIVGIVMEYVEGETLAEYIKNNISNNKIIDIFIMILTALEKIHDRGYIHRDLNPNNILIAGDSLKIIDFGTATKKDGTTDSYKNKTVIMTGFYAAPEQVSSDAEALVQSDIYSMGGIIYYCYIKEDPKKFIWSIKRYDLEKKEIPMPIIDIIHKATNFNPKDRYKDCKEMLLDLERIENKKILSIKIIDRIIDIQDGLTITNEMVGLKKGPYRILAKILFDLDKNKYFIERVDAGSHIYILYENKFIRKDMYYLEDGDILSLSYNKDKNQYFPIISCEVSE